MAYERKSNRCKFDGAPSPWATKLAAHCSQEIVAAGHGKTIFPADLPTIGRPILVLPHVTNHQVSAIVFHRPKLAGDKLRDLYHHYLWHRFDLLSEDWESYSHGFVRFHIDPTAVRTLVIDDHNASIRSASEIDEIERLQVPWLSDFDRAVGSSLVASRKEWSRVLNSHGCAVHFEPEDGAVTLSNIATAGLEVSDV